MKNQESDKDDQLKNNYPEYIEKIYEFKITKGQLPIRLDIFLTESIKNATRTKVQRAISEGYVTINGIQGRHSKKIQPGDVIVCKLLKPPPIELVPEEIPLDIFYEDNFLMVVNKPSGMCSHPGFGNRYGTLVNALLWHLGIRESISIDSDQDEDESDEIESDTRQIFSSNDIRPGLVHRLDKDTSGLLVISKDPVTHQKLQKQFADRTTSRYYNAIVWGHLKEPIGVIEGNIGRSSRDRKLFSVVKKNEGKFAKTEFVELEELKHSSLVQVKLHTGRTHQIRVHFSHIHHPVFGDPSYGGNVVSYSGQDPQLRKLFKDCLSMVNRQMLHAKTLGFKHPQTKKFLEFESELPHDMIEILNLLRYSE